MASRAPTDTPGTLIRIVSALFVALVYLGPIASGLCKEPSATSEPKKDMFEPLPFNNLASPEELKRDFYRMEFKPLGDPQLEMYFLVPKSWKSQPITVKKKALLRDHITTIKLVMMTSAKMRARIEVHYARVGEDVALAEFAKAFIKENRLKLIRHQPGEFTGRVVFDALVKAPKSELARLTFSRHKDRIIILSCTTAEKAYPEFAKVFGIATTSFKMVGDK